MSATYRWLGPDDLPHWRALRREMLQKDPLSFLTSLADFEAQPDDAVRAQLAQGKLVGAFHGDVMIGSAAFSRKPQSKACHRAELGAVYVNERYRGHGVANGLMGEIGARAKAEAVVQLELWVWDGNARAIAFYERCGFLMMGAMPRAVIAEGQPRHDLLYVCALDG